MQNISVIQFTQYIKCLLPEKNKLSKDWLFTSPFCASAVFNTQIMKMQQGLNPEQGVITLTLLKLSTSCPKNCFSNKTEDK